MSLTSIQVAHQLGLPSEIVERAEQEPSRASCKVLGKLTRFYGVTDDEMFDLCWNLEKRDFSPIE